MEKNGDGVFTLKRASEVLKDVIVGLLEVHRSGSVHRDIKNSNILVQSDLEGKEVVILPRRSSSWLTLAL